MSIAARAKLLHKGRLIIERLDATQFYAIGVVNSDVYWMQLFFSPPNMHNSALANVRPNALNINKVSYANNEFPVSQGFEYPRRRFH